MNYIKYSRLFALLAGSVLGIYGLVFYQSGYNIAMLFFVWAFVSFGANLYARKEPFKAFISAVVVSFVLYYILRYFIVEMREWPHYAIFILILSVYVGAAWDGYQWVYKFDYGRKLKTRYDD